MNMQKNLLVVAALAGSIQLASAADIVGTVKLKGTPPPEIKIPLDPNCGKLHDDQMTTRFYVVGPNGGLADTFVYIKEGLGDKKFETPKEPVVIDQDGCEYVPYVVGAQTGQTIVVKNSDPLLHNVHPTPTTPGNREYNKAQLPRGPDLKFSWDKPEVFLRFKCDVHPWMFSYVGLLEHPYYAVSEKEGKFRIKNVPPGKYVIEANHRKAHSGGKPIQKEITVEDKDVTLDFVVELPN